MTHEALELPSYELAQVAPDGTMRLMFHRGQWRAWASDRRYVVMMAGNQSGKTIFGPPWLHREIQSKGPGDYIAVSPSFRLMEKKMSPVFKHYFCDQLQLGDFRGSNPPLFTMNDEGMKRTHGDTKEVARAPHTQVFFGHAANSDSLESATAKAVWMDEAGMDAYTISTWNALRRRAGIHRARFLFSTTLYNLGWLKQVMYDPWLAGAPDIDVIQFDSLTNPVFPKDEYEERERDLPRWMFDMQYRGIYSRPAGLIYDTFDTARHIVDDFEIPSNWPRFLGVDFGAVNTAGVVLAEDPNTKRLYQYREYHKGGMTEEQHIGNLLAGEPQRAVTPRAWGGSHQEGGWRSAYTQSGLTVQEPMPNDVEIQIRRVYGALRRDELSIFKSCEGTIEQFATYSRKLDPDTNEVTTEIANKAAFHYMDALRYVVSQIRRGRPLGSMIVRPASTGLLAALPRYRTS